MKTEDTFRFLKWEVYKDSQDFFTFILHLVKKMPKEFRYELGSQIIRSSFSIILNIAEGSGKDSDAELKHFFNISLGSVNETFAGFDTFRYNKFIQESEFTEGVKRLSSISRQLGGFKKKIASQMSIVKSH